MVYFSNRIEYQIITTPNSTHTSSISYFSSNGNGQDQFWSNYYNTAVATVTFNSTDNFTTVPNGSGFNCTLMQYWRINYIDVNNFDNQHCQIIGSSNHFEYQIISNNYGKMLIITNTNTGNKIYYNGDVLNTNEVYTLNKYS